MRQGSVSPLRGMEGEAQRACEPDPTDGLQSLRGAHGTCSPGSRLPFLEHAWLALAGRAGPDFSEHEQPPYDYFLELKVISRTQKNKS